MSTAEKYDPRPKLVELSASSRRDDPPHALSLPDGTTAALMDDTLELRDPQGALIFRYREGTAEVHVPRGDLSLCAPHGRIKLEAGLDVTVDAARDVVHRAQRRIDSCAGGDEPKLRVAAKETTVSCERLAVNATVAEGTFGRGSLVARHLATSATTLVLQVERYELTASRLIERSRNAFREVGDLLQTSARRVRTLVDDVHTLHSRRNIMVSEDDTSIDGKRILLG